MVSPAHLLVAGEWVATEKALPVINPWDESTICEVPLATEAVVDAAIAAAGVGRRGDAPAARPRPVSASVPRRRPARTAARRVHRLHHRRIGQAPQVRRGRDRPRSRDAPLRRGRSPAHPRRNRADGRGARVGEPPRLLHSRPARASSPPSRPSTSRSTSWSTRSRPRFAAGNSVVLKPATKTPLTALRLGAALLEAGLPPRALNIVVGAGGTVGAPLVRDSRIRMVTFTGSPDGRRANQARLGPQARRARTRLQLRRDDRRDGRPRRGASPAAWPAVSPTPARSASTPSGCTSTSPSPSSSPPGSSTRPRGSPAATRHCPSTDIGPMIDRNALSRGLALVEEARAGGAEVLCGGRAEGTVMLPDGPANVRPGDAGRLRRGVRANRHNRDIPRLRRGRGDVQRRVRRSAPTTTGSPAACSPAT